MNVFNLISAGGGKSEGLYVWKKYGLGPDVKVLTSNYNDSWASDYQFSRTIYESTEYEFINGKYQLINPTAHTVTGTAGANSYGTKAGHFYVVDENPASEMFEVVSGCTYPPSWIIGTGPYQLILQGSSSLWSSAYKPIHYILGHVMVDYVVSDKEDAYPDGGEQGGYYYERLSILEADSFDCDSIESGSIVCTSSGTTLRINHSLGVIPKGCILTYDTSKPNTGVYREVAVYGTNSSYGSGIYSSKTSLFSPSVTATKTYINFVNPSNTNAYFIEGVAYEYILFA